MKDMIWRCDLVPQYLEYKSEIKEVIDQVLQSGKYILATQVKKLEQEFASFVGCQSAIGVNSGTDALVLGLKCLGVGVGDEVITTPFTAIPTYAAIRQVGATPVFVDIDPNTFLMDSTLLPQAITEKTKAILPVHIFGNVVDVDQIREIVGNEILILEDCAQSHGARIRGKQTGSMGDLAAFSFYPTKNLGGYGDGGIIVTNNSNFAEKAKLLRMYGMINKDEFILDGMNSRLDEIQASILRVKLKYLNKMNQLRKIIANTYISKLDSQVVIPQQYDQDVEPVFHVFSVCCQVNRKTLEEHLASHHIQTNMYYCKPLYQQKPYQKIWGKHANLPNVENVCDKVLALPLYPEMSAEIINTVIEKINIFSN